MREVGKDSLNTIAVKMDEEGDFYGLNQKATVSGSRPMSTTSSDRPRAALLTPFEPKPRRDHKETTVAGAVKSGYAGRPERDTGA